MRRNVTNKEVENNVKYLLSNMGSGSVSLKSFTFEGVDENGISSNIVDLPKDCNIIIGVMGEGTLQDYDITVTANIIYLTKATIQTCMTIYSGNNYIEGSVINCLYSVENGKIKFEQIDNGNPFNYQISYTVYYI